MYKSSKINRMKFKSKVKNVAKPQNEATIVTNFKLAGKAAKDRKLTRKLIADALGAGGYLSIDLLKYCDYFKDFKNLLKLENPPYKEVMELLQNIRNNPPQRDLKKAAGYMLNLFESAIASKGLKYSKGQYNRTYISQKNKDGSESYNILEVEKKDLFSGSTLARTANTLVKKHDWKTINIAKSAQFLIDNLKLNIWYKGDMLGDCKAALEEVKKLAAAVVENPLGTNEDKTNMDTLIDTLQNPFPELQIYDCKIAQKDLDKTIGNALRIISGDNFLGAAKKKIDDAIALRDTGYGIIKKLYDSYYNKQEKFKKMCTNSYGKIIFKKEFEEFYKMLMQSFAECDENSGEPNKLLYRGLGDVGKELFKELKNLYTLCKSVHLTEKDINDVDTFTRSLGDFETYVSGIKIDPKKHFICKDLCINIKEYIIPVLDYADKYFINIKNMGKSQTN